MVMDVGAIYKGSLFSPSSVLTEMRSVDNAVSRLAEDVGLSKVEGRFKQSYANFVKEWGLFYSENDDWLSRTLNTTYALVLDYRERVRKWAEAFERQGGKTTTPLLTTPKPTSIRLGYFGAGLLAAVAIYALVKQQE